MKGFLIFGIIVGVLLIIVSAAMPAATPRSEAKITTENDAYESVGRYIRGELISQLTSRPNEWYEYWFDWARKDPGIPNNIWVKGGITFTQANYTFKSVMFIFYSPDNGRTWHVKWRSDQGG